MKIWCCLCFGEEDEDRRKGKETTRGALLENESEGRLQDMENDQSEALELRFPFGRNGAEELRPHLSDARESPQIEGLGIGLRGDDGLAMMLGTSRCFYQLDSSSNEHGMMEVNLNLVLGEGPSSSLAALERQSGHQVSHRKRPKVLSFSLDSECHCASVRCSDGNCCSLYGRDYNVNQSYLKNDGNENPLGFGIGNETKEDGFGTLKMED